jgi:hypothetical protein
VAYVGAGEGIDVLGRRPDGKRPIGRPSRRRGMERIAVDQDWDPWRAVVIAIKNLRVP